MKARILGNNFRERIIDSIKKIRGIREVKSLDKEHVKEIVRIEEEAEKKSLLGLGKVVNTGITDVLNCQLLLVALTDMNFDWGKEPTLVLKKGEEIVGEEVRDENVIKKLSEDKDVWFMHRNFVVYKKKISFPEDIMKKICHFEIPSLNLQCELEDDYLHQCKKIIFANPSTPCDVFLKDKYFGGLDDRGLGTILIGVE